MKSKTKIFTAIVLIITLSLSTTSTTMAAYNGKAASEYAKKWAKKRNPNYPAFGADCTNFVSQCVFNGGISKKYIPKSKISYGNLGDVYKTREYWDSTKWTVAEYFMGFKLREKEDFVFSSTWSVVAKNKNDSWWGFYNYMQNRGASCKEFKVNTVANLNTFIQNCQVGDVLQKRSSTSTNKSHSVIVTEKTYDSKNKRWNMKIAYHSNDTAPTDFRTESWKKFGTDTLWTIINLRTI